MSRHRILIVGASGSGRSWLARRIHDLTGIAVHDARPAGTSVPAAEHEWIVLAGQPEGLDRCLERADLVVLLCTPRWLRGLRIALAGLPMRARHPGWRGAGAEWRASRGWDDAEGAAWAARLGRRGGGADLVMKCGSSEDVRAVLERVFGIDASDDPAWPGRLAG